MRVGRVIVYGGCTHIEGIAGTGVFAARCIKPKTGELMFLNKEAILSRSIQS
jgi:hypothetical protein